MTVAAVHGLEHLLFVCLAIWQRSCVSPFRGCGAASDAEISGLVDWNFSGSRRLVKMQPDHD